MNNIDTQTIGEIYRHIKDNPNDRIGIIEEIRKYLRRPNLEPNQIIFVAIVNSIALYPDQWNDGEVKGVVGTIHCESKPVKSPGAALFNNAIERVFAAIIDILYATDAVTTDYTGLISARFNKMGERLYLAAKMIRIPVESRLYHEGHIGFIPNQNEDNETEEIPQVEYIAANSVFDQTAQRAIKLANNVKNTKELARLLAPNNVLKQLQIENELKRFFCTNGTSPGSQNIDANDLIRFYVTYGPNDEDIIREMLNITKLPFFTFHRTVPKDDLSPSMYFLRFSESFHSSWAYVEDNANAPNNNNNNTIDGQNGTTISNKDYYQYTLVTISQSGYEKHRIKWDLDSRTFIRLDPHGNRTVASTLLESFPPNILFYDRSAYPDEVKFFFLLFHILILLL
jgi:hypothetical protein